MTRRIALICAIAVCTSIASPTHVRASQPTYASSRSLVLSQSLLPSRYKFRSVKVQYSVAEWDSNVRQVMLIDEQNGWVEGARELASDAKRRAVHITVQLFRGSTGARADFLQFFTNSHPETIYNPQAQWLGASSIGGLGKPATIYRYSDSGAGCPHSLVSGISYVFGNALFSVEACLYTTGEGGVTDLAKRILSRAHAVAKKGAASS